MFTKKILCHRCQKEFEKGEFMAVIAKAPTKSYVSNTEAILEKWINTTDGKAYCQKCFNEAWEEK